MFSIAVRCGKAFAAEQNIRELKKRIFRLLTLGKNTGLKKCPNKIMTTDNMNSIPTPKYGIPPEIVPKRYFSSDRYK